MVRRYSHFQINICLFPLQISPQSRGSVTLASADPTVLPKIDPAWLTSPTDQTLAIEMYKKVRRIFNTTAFRAVRDNTEEFYPGAQFLPAIFMGFGSESDYFV